MSSGEHPITIPEFDQEDDDLFQKLEEKIVQEEGKTSSIGQGQGSYPVTKIQRVPDVMRAENKHLSYLVPHAMAIGPIHRARSYRFLVDEDLKFKWAAKYLDGLDGKKILQEIKGEIKSLMEKFDDDCLEKDGNSLARMLFVDGCAMLQFIYSFVWDDMKHLKINAAQATLVQQDLFLLENQIPFRVLQIIMKAGKNKRQKEIKSYTEKLTKMETAVHMFIHLSNMSPALQREVSLKFDSAVHLLDLLRQSLVDDSAESDDFSNSAFNCLLVKFPVFIIFKLPFYVLCLLVCLAATTVFTFFYIIYRFIHFLKRSTNPPTPYLEFFCCDMLIYLCIGEFGSPTSPITRRTFRKAQELKAAGIEMKPSKSWCLNEGGFSFGFFTGYIRLCPILVDKSTAGKLLNLIAYEMCPDYHCKITEDSERCDYRISSYIRFLDSLIDDEQDVKVLREANMVRHLLSSDKEVAELFNNIGPISWVANDAYDNVNFERDDYYKRKIRIWITEFRREHLSSPWTLLALIAAAAALSLTAAQTYFSINPR